MDDLMAFTESVDDKFGGRDVPHFLVGHSMGGFLATKLSIEAPDRFTGMSLFTPFFDLYDQSIIKAMPIAKVLNWVIPVYPLHIRPKYLVVPKWAEHFDKDPLYQGDYSCVQNLLQFETMQDEVKNCSTKVQTPFRITLAGLENIVCNKAAKKFFTDAESNP